MGDRELMAELLAIAKNLAPARVPNPTPQIINFWAADLKLERFPRALWIEAVRHWVKTSYDSGRQLESAALGKAAYTIRDLWESDPAKRAILNETRQARLNARISRGELPVGTTPINALEAATDANLNGSETKAEIKKAFFAQLAQKRVERETDKNSTNSTPTEALNNLEALANKYTKGGDAHA